MNHSEIAHRWANKSNRDANGSAMHYTGGSDYLYTWGTHLAKHLEDGAVLVNVTSYSNSSAKHASHMWRAISNLTDDQIFRIGHLNRGDVLRDITGTQVYEYALAQAVQQWNAAKRARVNRDYCVELALKWVHRANRAREFFLLRRAPLVENQSTLETLAGKLARLTKAQERKAERTRKQAEERAARRLKEEIAETRDLLTEWRAGRISESEIHVSTAAILAVLGATADGFAPNAALRLSADGSRVETSQGAQVLVRSVRFLWEYAAGARATGREVPDETTERFPSLDHYMVNSIDAHGNVTAGCHRLAFAEIEGIAKALNLPPFNGHPMQQAQIPAETV